MFIQDTLNRADVPVQSAVLRNHYTAAMGWQILSTNCLHNFDRVGAQFTALGLAFEAAIAIRPSNPRFLTRGYDTSVIPTDTATGIKISLQRNLSKLRLWVIGSEAVMVSAINADGHCTTVAQTPSASVARGPQTYPEHCVTVDARSATVIRVESKAPFVLTQVGIMP